MTPEKKPVGRPPERLQVSISFNMGPGHETFTDVVTWPKNWPLPVQGDMVVSAEDGLYAKVQRYRFDPAKGKLTIEAAP